VLPRQFWLLEVQECGVPRSPGFGPESESLISRRLRLWALSVLSGLLCNFVEVCLTFVQFISQLKPCTLLCTFYYNNFKISLKSSLSTQSLCHTISPRVRVGVWFWAPESERSVCVPKSESESHEKGLHIPVEVHCIVLCEDIVTACVLCL